MLVATALAACTRNPAPSVPATNAALAEQRPTPASQPPPVEPPAVPLGCLPVDFHGPLRESRGQWNLYDGRTDYPRLLLEHTGSRLVIAERDVADLRARLGGGFVDGVLHGVGHSLCALDISPRRGTCLGVMLLTGSDPFVAAARLDAHLGAAAADACYGVAVTLEELATF